MINRMQCGIKRARICFQQFEHKYNHVKRSWHYTFCSNTCLIIFFPSVELCSPWISNELCTGSFEVWDYISIRMMRLIKCWQLRRDISKKGKKNHLKWIEQIRLNEYFSSLHFLPHDFNIQVLKYKCLWLKTVV